MHNSMKTFFQCRHGNGWAQLTSADGRIGIRVLNGSITVNVAPAGLYTLSFRYAAPFGDQFNNVLCYLKIFTGRVVKIVKVVRQ